MAKESKREELVAGLQKEAERIQGELSELEERAEAVRGELQQVQGALAALMGKKVGSKEKVKASRPAGRGLNLNEVGLIIETILKREGPLQEADLKRQVGEEADQKGKIKTGLHLLVKKALSDQGRFVLAETGWKLKD